MLKKHHSNLNSFSFSLTLSSHHHSVKRLAIYSSEYFHYSLCEHILLLHFPLLLDAEIIQREIKYLFRTEQQRWSSLYSFTTCSSFLSETLRWGQSSSDFKTQHKHSANYVDTRRRSQAKSSFNPTVLVWLAYFWTDVTLLSSLFLPSFPLWPQKWVFLTEQYLLLLLKRFGEKDTLVILYQVSEIHKYLCLR